MKKKSDMFSDSNVMQIQKVFYYSETENLKPSFLNVVGESRDL